MGVSGEGRQFELVRFSGTPEQVSEAWRAERRKGVGGSDVAAIMGMSPYKSPYEVWAEKTGVVEPPTCRASSASCGETSWSRRRRPLPGAAPRAGGQARQRDVSFHSPTMGAGQP